jgi:putative addiction module component (TIGR02574 family)
MWGSSACELRGTSWLRRVNFVSGVARKMIEEALKLPEDERAEIAGELLVSLDGNGVALGPSSEAVEDRIARRLAEADDGRVTPMSWDEAQRFIDSDEPDR